MASELELRLEAHYPQYRRIWVHGSNKGKYRLCLTLFPRWHGMYEMAFGEVQELTFENVVKIINDYLQKSK